MAEIDEIKTMKKDIEFLKNNMVDIDSIMTEEDFETLLNYRIEKQEGTLVDEDDLKKELGFNV